MIIVKLIVILVCVEIVFGNLYCNICPGHTLCKYASPGPDESCRLYDKTVKLTRDDVNKILNKLNERRSYAAMGYSKFLPAAANMRRIYWSEELALSAQRWVDQCDQSLWPDKEDQCRDLKNVPVGQNIATVAGATSTFDVKSLVDTWFMKILDYNRSVSYYNQSRDSKTKYFTQMIWAETNLVGCGRAKFYIDHKNSIVERLVCNFAPRGNIHGKPVYAIGFPATQCPEETRPDADYKGLCSRYIEQRVNSTNVTVRKTTTPSSKVSSLLRILNLSNDSAKQAIDPIRSNSKQFKPNSNGSVEQRSQKIRHIVNNTNDFIGIGARRVDHVTQVTSDRSNRKSIITGTPVQERRFHVQGRGHSRVHHERHMLRDKETPSPRTTDFMTNTYEDEISPDIRNYNLINQCTRTDTATLYKMETHYLPMPNAQNQCTRKSKLAAPTTYHDKTYCQQDVCSRELCPCNVPVSIYTQTTTCSTLAPMSTKCTCSFNCQCPKLIDPTNGLQDHLKLKDIFSDNTRKSTSVLDYYDQKPNIGIRSGGTIIQNHKVNNKILPIKRGRHILKNNTSFLTYRTSSIHTKKFDFHERVKNYMGHKVLHMRKRRALTKETVYKPFWQVDDVSTKKFVELKSLRYTTLSNKRKRIKYRTQSTFTEPITFKLSENNQVNKNIFGTEKYLSFDELMRLRKLGETDIIDVYAARRTGKTTAKAAATTKAGATTKSEATTKAASATTKAASASKATTKTTKSTTKTTTKTTKTKTKEITTNTPFERKKYCTRMLTCTWTAITVTGSDGSVIGGAQLEVGSLTPPGYVEGCTRTFTCTRIYMDKNKFTAVSDESGEYSRGEEAQEQGSVSNGDEDYCEKRALDIHRRESGDDSIRHHSTLGSLSQLSSPISNNNYEASTEKMHYAHYHESSAQNDCMCNEEISRVKRNEIHYNQLNTRENISYGDLYYRVLQKIIGGWKNHRHNCACNYGIRNRVNFFLLLFCLIFLLT